MTKLRTDIVTRSPHLEADIVQEVAIADIQVGQRIRKELGDLEALAKSVTELGLLQPIGITPDRRLVFGERRLRAYRDVLLRGAIPARVVQMRAVLAGQVDENNLRKDYTVSERVAIVEALRRFDHGGDRRSDQLGEAGMENLTLDEAAKRAGLGGKDGYYRAINVLEHGVPELITAMDADELAVAAAARIAELSPEDQRHSVRAGRRKVGRDPYDHYPTPPQVTEALLEHEGFPNVVWEPACGTGAMSQVLEQAGYDVRSTDLIYRGFGKVENFLQSSFVARSIITNPPFQLAQEFVEQALRSATEKVAMFLPLTFLEGERRRTLFTRSPLKTVHVFSSRVSLYKADAENRGNGRVAYAWFVWQHGYDGPPTVSWITASPEEAVAIPY